MNWSYIDHYCGLHQGAMVVAELAQLVAEARQLVRQDMKTYFRSPWNLMDLGAAVALIVGAVGHFRRSGDIVHLSGALGVALKWFSAVWGSVSFYLLSSYSQRTTLLVAKSVTSTLVGCRAQAPWTTCGASPPRRRLCG